MAYNLVRRITRFWLSLRHQRFSRRYRRLVLEEVDGVPLIILPNVFNPVLFRTGRFLARSLTTVSMDTAITVLDMGTGSGIGAVFAARRAARVVAVDVNPEAVRCAKLNALLNHFEDRREKVEADFSLARAMERFIGLYSGQ
ncbi:MAG TPA: 50S ribosomal protein L11 methyltransferase [Anaerolineales bacterium]|nr:50S ribosomal protein L11 methyltransferase [Anaerolineales bacterium]